MIVSHVEEGLPTIISVTDVASGAVNTKLTPGGGLTGSGQRIKIAGETGDAVGFFFVKDGSQTSVAVPMTSVLRNDPSAFSLIIPALEDGTYYLEVATRSSGNSKVFLKEVRRNRFPYPLTVGGGDGDSESPMRFNFYSGCRKFSFPHRKLSFPIPGSSRFRYVETSVSAPGNDNLLPSRILSSFLKVFPEIFPYLWPP